MICLASPHLRDTVVLAVRRCAAFVGAVAAFTGAAASSQSVDPFLDADSAVYVTDVGSAFGPAPVSLASGYAGDYDARRASVGWELLPDGLIYRSYMAGPRESRLALHTFSNNSSSLGDESLWEATLGGRAGVIRYGNGDPTNPAGWQIDIEGATIVRLNLDQERDVEASDFRFGVPVTWGDRELAYKFGYYHISSHLGDERLVRTGEDRINYVRDALLFGASWYPDPRLRVYGEIGYAFFTAGGAEPWELQFGFEYACPGPTGFYGTPFVASNAHLREESDFGGDWTLQAGWLWRGDTGHLLRLGVHYMNGLSTQYQWFNENEEQIGFGIWYDF